MRKRHNHIIEINHLEVTIVTRTNDVHRSDPESGTPRFVNESELLPMSSSLKLDPVLSPLELDEQPEGPALYRPLGPGFLARAF